MGQMWTAYVTNPDTAPDLNNLPTFDPEYGFPDGRPKREMVASQEEMNMARVPMDKRDFCAHFYIAFLKCRRDNFPNLLNCRHAKHDYDHCEYEDFVIRMKEYERERRLLERGKRKRLVAEREALED